MQVVMGVPWAVATMEGHAVLVTRHSGPQSHAFRMRAVVV